MTWRERAAIIRDILGRYRLPIGFWSVTLLSAPGFLDPELADGHRPVGVLVWPAIGCLVLFQRMEWQRVMRTLPLTRKDLGRALWLATILLCPAWIGAVFCLGATAFGVSQGSVLLVLLDIVALFGTCAFLIGRLGRPLGLLCTVPTIAIAVAVALPVLPAEIVSWRALPLAVGLACTLASYRSRAGLVADVLIVRDARETKLRTHGPRMVPERSHHHAFPDVWVYPASLAVGLLVIPMVLIWTNVNRGPAAPLSGGTLATASSFVAFLVSVLWTGMSVSSPPHLRLLRSLPIPRFRLYLIVTARPLLVFLGVAAPACAWLLVSGNSALALALSEYCLALGGLFAGAALCLRTTVDSGTYQVPILGSVFGVLLVKANWIYRLSPAIPFAGGAILFVLGLVAIYILLTRSSCPYRHAIERKIEVKIAPTRSHEKEADV